MNKKAQVTIFIIAAIVVIAVIALIFLLRIERIPFVPEKLETNPRAFISSCIEEHVKGNLSLMLSQGGFVDPQNYHMFEDSKVAYLCYNSGNFYPCVNQHPMFLTEISQELENVTRPLVEECFNEFKESLEEKGGYEIELGESMEVNVSISPKTIIVNIMRDLTITRAEEKESYEKMSLSYSSSLYELVGIANQIANEEAKFCSFDVLGYMNLYSNYLILRKKMSDSTKIYSIKDKQTQEQLNIGIRGCVLK